MLLLFTDESLTPGSPQVITQEENHTYLSIGWGWRRPGTLQGKAGGRHGDSVGRGTTWGGGLGVFLLGWGGLGLDSSWRVKQSCLKGKVQEVLLRTVLCDFHSWSLGPVKVKSEAGWELAHDSGRRSWSSLVCPDRSLKAENPHRCNSLSLLIPP